MQKCPFHRRNATKRNPSKNGLKKNFSCAQKKYGEKCGELWGILYLWHKIDATSKKNMRFTGNIDAKVDEKGRVFVPSSFRKILQKEETQGLIMRRDIFQRCLILYPQEVWDAQVDAITERTNMFDRQGRDALRRFVAGAEAISLDSGGRMLIPRRYLEETGIQNEVRFIGVDNTIEIWSRQAAETLLAEPEILADNLESMMKPHETF